MLRRRKGVGVLGGMWVFMFLVFGRGTWRAWFGGRAQGSGIHEGRGVEGIEAVGRCRGMVGRAR